MSTTTFDYTTKTMITANEGLVLSTGTRLAQIMSDVWENEAYAIVWSPEKGMTQQVHLYYADMDRNGKRGSATVDATPEVKAAFREWQIKLEMEAMARKDYVERRKIVKGSIVKVTKGRSNKGLVGKVVAETQGTYNMGYRASSERKLAIALDDVTITVAGRNGRSYERNVNVAWVWAFNCELDAVVDADFETFREEATRRVDGPRYGWAA